MCVAGLAVGGGPGLSLVAHEKGRAALRPPAPVPYSLLASRRRSPVSSSRAAATSRGQCSSVVVLRESLVQLSTTVWL